jgi:hypothetical protein
MPLLSPATIVVPLTTPVINAQSLEMRLELRRPRRPVLRRILLVVVGVKAAVEGVATVQAVAVEEEPTLGRILAVNGVEMTLPRILERIIVVESRSKMESGK